MWPSARQKRNKKKKKKKKAKMLIFCQIGGEFGSMDTNEKSKFNKIELSSVLDLVYQQLLFGFKVRTVFKRYLSL